MGRKKKKDEEGGFWLGLFVIALMLVPVALLIARVYFGRRAGTTRKRLNSGEQCFELNEDELLELRYKRAELRRVTSLLRAAMQRGSDANLTLNKDGSFSARSNLGKSIRAMVEKYEPTRAKLIAEVSDLEQRPQLRWNTFRADVRHQSACEWGLWVWALVFGCTYGYAWMTNGKTELGSSALLAGLAAAMAYGSGYFLLAHRARRFVPNVSESATAID